MVIVPCRAPGARTKTGSKASGAQNLSQRRSDASAERRSAPLTRSRDPAARVHLIASTAAPSRRTTRHHTPPEPGRRQISGHDHLDARHPGTERTPALAAARMTQVNETNELMTQIHDA